AVVRGRGARGWSFFFQAEDGIRDGHVTGVQTCALPISEPAHLFYSDDLGRGWQELPALRSVDTSRWSFPAPPNVAHTKHINFHRSEERRVGKECRSRGAP